MSGTTSSPELQAAAATNGAVEVVVAAMRRCPGDSERLGGGRGFPGGAQVAGLGLRRLGRRRIELAIKLSRAQGETAACERSWQRDEAHAAI